MELIYSSRDLSQSIKIPANKNDYCLYMVWLTFNNKDL